MELIITSPDQLKNLISEAVGAVLANKQLAVNSEDTVVRISSIKAGAAFLGMSEPTFQTLKNSGKIRYYQTGRKFIIYSNELLEDLAKIQQAKRNRHESKE
jgi:hypothetical protein